MSLKEPTLSPHAAELKSRANDLFKDGKFTQAFDVFTAAISEAENSPTLYSNRSAAAIRMKNFAQALKDAEKAVKLDPDWEKAHGRVAAAHECLAQFQSAFDSYVKAASLAKDGQVQKLEFNHERMPDGAPMPKGGIAINIAVYVSVPVLDVMGRLVACVLQDPKGSCVYRATTWTMPKRLVDALHFVFYQFPHAPRREMTPSKVIKHFSKLQREHGWDSMRGPLEGVWEKMFPVDEDGRYVSVGVRFLLACTIRLSILEGWYLESFAGDYGTAQQKYAQAHNIIALARAEWPGQADANLGGTSLQRTFWRAVGSRVLECRLQVAKARGFKANSDDMAQLEQLANEQLQSCQKYPVPRPKPSDPVDQFVYWVAFDTAIRAEAYMTLGTIHALRGEQQEKVVGNLIYMDPEEGRRALELSLHASACYPPDDLNFACAMWSALLMQVRIGGISLAAMDTMVASAKKIRRRLCSISGSRRPQRMADIFYNFRRNEVLRFHEEFHRLAAQRKNVNPSKLILRPTAQYRKGRAGERVQVQKLQLEAMIQDASSPRHHLDPNDETTSRVSIIEVFDSAKQDMQRSLDLTPAVYLDD